MTEIARIYRCSSCAAEPLKGEQPCQRCGANGRTIDVNVQSTIAVVTAISGKLKDPTLPKRKRTRLEFYLGRQLNHATGEFVHKDWRIDRRAKIYWEKIRDARGRFVHWVQQELGKHRGHGSDRPGN